MRSGLVVLAIAAAGWAVDGAPAQEKRPAGGQQPGSAQIVQNEAVQNELQLTADQREAILHLPRRIEQKFKAEREKIRDLQNDEMREKQRELRAKYAAEFPKALDEILTSAQRSRLKQLQLQHTGALAFGRPEVVKALGISDDQKRMIDGFARQWQDATLDAYRRHGETGEGRKLAAEYRKQALAKIDASLDERQRGLWKDMTGTPFDFPAPMTPVPAADARPAAPVEKPGLERGSPKWVEERVRAWQPTDQDRQMDRIGWVSELQEATRLAQKFERPIFLFNFSGRVELGRC
jgi:hypothetical protein